MRLSLRNKKKQKNTLTLFLVTESEGETDILGNIIRGFFP